MQSNLFTAVLLPLALAIVMLGMGLSLAPADFQRVTRYPKAVVLGLLCQLGLLPLIGVLIARVVPMQPGRYCRATQQPRYGHPRRCL